MLPFFSRKWRRAQAWLNAIALRKLRRNLPKQEATPPLIYKVLCVDDDPDFCLYVQRIAQPLGIQLETAYSIEEAKQAIEKSPDYQAFIIDGHLPDGSGFELVAWIREKKGVSAPLGFISRIYQDATSFRLLKENLKVNYVLDKPLSPHEIDQLLKQLCHLEPPYSAEEPFPENMMAELKEKYQQSIANKLERLEKLILNVQKEPTVNHLQTLQGEIHKIAGSSGSYGYMVVSELCKNLELEVIEQVNLAKQNQLNPQWLASLDDFFTQVKLHFQIEPILPTAQKELFESYHLPSVYVVEEDPLLVETLKRSKKESHFNLSVESQPSQAIQTLLSSDVYLQLLLVNAHYRTSPLTGYDLIKAFYERHDFLTTVIGLIVEERDLERQVEAIQRGMNLILAKPFSFSFVLPFLNQMPLRALPLPYKILVVDDDPDICQYIMETLKYAGLTIQTLMDVNQLEEIVGHYQPDLILLDIHLVDQSGMEILRWLRQRLKYDKLLVGMISAIPQEMGLIQKCYDANVHAILFKPLERGLLQRKIAFLLRKQMEEALAAVKDPITGLENAKTLKSYLDQCREHRDISVKSLVIFDVEGAIVNEQELLSRVAEALEELFKKYEMAAYMGQRRFALVFRGYDSQFIQLIMHHFLLRVQSDLHVRLNGGIVVWSDEMAHEVLSRGEQALHLAKQQPEQPVRLVLLGKPSLVAKEVAIIYEESGNVDVLKNLFEAHGFKVSVSTHLEGLYQRWFEGSLSLPLPLLILTGLTAEAMGVSLLKKLAVHQLQLPLLYFSHSPTGEHLENLLKGVGYFDFPFNLMMIMSKTPVAIGG